jgi:hypothetical protein
VKYLQKMPNFVKKHPNDGNLNLPTKCSKMSWRKNAENEKTRKKFGRKKARKEGSKGESFA